MCGHIQSVVPFSLSSMLCVSVCVCVGGGGGGGGGGGVHSASCCTLIPAPMCLRAPMPPTAPLLFVIHVFVCPIQPALPLLSALYIVCVAPIQQGIPLHLMQPIVPLPSAIHVVCDHHSTSCTRSFCDLCCVSPIQPPITLPSVTHVCVCVFNQPYPSSHSSILCVWSPFNQLWPFYLPSMLCVFPFSLPYPFFL